MRSPRRAREGRAGPVPQLPTTLILLDLIVPGMSGWKPGAAHLADPPVSGIPWWW